MKKLLLVSLILAQCSLFANPVNEVSPQLGGGYSTDDNQALPLLCINSGPITYSGSNTGLVDLSRMYDLNTVEDQLGIKVKGHVGFSAFSADTKADFMHYVSNQSLSESLIYRTNLQFKDTNYNIPTSGPVLNANGSKWINDPISFRQYCGDSYVAQMHHGAYLYVTLQLQFLTAQDKTNFNAEFSGDFASLANLTADIERKIDQSHINGNIHIIALQEGGNPQYLSTLFESVDPNKPSPISECTFNKIESCQGLMDAVMKYISNPATGFPSQLIPTPGKDIPDSAADIGFEPEDYNAIVPAHSNSKLTPQIIDMRDNLGNLLMQNQTDEQRAYYLLNSLSTYPYVYDNFLQNLNNTLQTLSRNDQIITNAGLACFDDLDDCIAMGQQAIASLTPFDRQTLAVPDTFTISETSTTSGTTQQLFVITEDSPAPPAVQTFLGTQISPTIGGQYDVTVQFMNSKVFMTKRDHQSQRILAQYQGTMTDQNTYSGTVTYSPTSSGTWSGTLVHSADTLSKN